MGLARNLLNTSYILYLQWKFLSKKFFWHFFLMLHNLIGPPRSHRRLTQNLCRQLSRHFSLVLAVQRSKGLGSGTTLNNGQSEKYFFLLSGSVICGHVVYKLPFIVDEKLKLVCEENPWQLVSTTLLSSLESSRNLVNEVLTGNLPLDSYCISHLYNCLGPSSSILVECK